ncbi:unnamed protein product, partial [Mesorhabditis belari]|uniref:Uncharacterized protein n=1 Tax=Mesorhabditis belari TaxID=2138241 RepID=A0AAF3FBR9_9BILA
MRNSFIVLISFASSFVFLEGASYDSMRTFSEMFRIRKDLDDSMRKEGQPWASRDFVRPIGSIAGEPIYPGRFESNVGVESYIFDENGIAFPQRARPSIETIINRGFRGNRFRNSWW